MYRLKLKAVLLIYPLKILPKLVSLMVTHLFLFLSLNVLIASLSLNQWTKPILKLKELFSFPLYKKL